MERLEVVAHAEQKMPLALDARQQRLERPVAEPAADPEVKLLREDLPERRGKTVRVDPPELRGHRAAPSAAHPTNACSPPTVASTYGGSGSTLDANIPMIAQLQMELGVAAFAADLTRCVVMQIGDQAGSTMILSWLTSAAGTPYAAGGPNPGDANTGDVNAYHAISHRNVADKVICDKWFQDQLGYVIGLMKSVADPTGATMLDSSVVVGMSNMRTGTHETTDLPFVIAGSCGGYFKLGRSIVVPSGTSNNGLLVALVNAMGAGPITTYGGTAGAAYGTELLALSQA